MVTLTQKELFTTPVSVESLLEPKPIERKDHLRPARYRLVLSDSFLIGVHVRVYTPPSPLPRILHAVETAILQTIQQFRYPRQFSKVSKVYMSTTSNGTTFGRVKFHRQWEFIIDGRFQDVLQEMRRIRQYHAMLQRNIYSALQLIENSEAQFLQLLLELDDTSFWSRLERTVVQREPRPQDYVRETQKPRKAAIKEHRKKHVPKEKPEVVYVPPGTPERELKKKGVLQRLGEGIGKLFGSLFGKRK
jgi:hypothetical protein